jgi:hypothetical protein
MPLRSLTPGDENSMRDTALAGARPTAVKAYAVLLLLSAVFMALLGWSASACYVPAACLLLLNLLCGGPLMAIWGGAMLPALRRATRSTRTRCSLSRMAST